MIISWTTYLTGSFALLVVYYGAVKLIFFRNEGWPFVKLPGIKPASQPMAPISHPPVADQQEAGSLDAASAAPMHSLVDELQAFISQAGIKRMGKDKLTGSLKRLLLQYPAIRGSLFQEGITNLIAVSVENNCGIHLSAEELTALWQA